MASRLAWCGQKSSRSRLPIQPRIRCVDWPRDRPLHCDRLTVTTVADLTSAELRLLRLGCWGPKSDLVVIPLHPGMNSRLLPATASANARPDRSSTTLDFGHPHAPAPLVTVGRQSPYGSHSPAWPEARRSPVSEQSWLTVTGSVRACVLPTSPCGPYALSRHDATASCGVWSRDASSDSEPVAQVTVTNSPTLQAISMRDRGSSVHRRLR